MSEDELVKAAREARKRAHAPFSNFHVGAAVETASGAVIAGCNVENASYGLTMCAERTALFAAIAAGHKEGDFTRMVIVGGETATAPCGACRQIIWELAGDIEIILANSTTVLDRMKMSTLLPKPFDAKNLKAK